jgi:hypothetical protein
MNWLTDQLAQESLIIPGLARMARVERDPGLRLVHFGDVVAAMAPFDRGGVWWRRRVLTNSFLLVEDEEAAQNRLDAAADAAEPLTSHPFTLAVADGSGTVLYLPEDTELPASLQLFVENGPRLTRVRALGAFGSTYAVLEAVDAVELDTRCTDGPCSVWGAGCGDGCRCEKQEQIAETGSAAIGSLAARFGPGRVYGLKCR